MPARLALRLALLALVTIIALPGGALACSCMRPTIERRVLPADGSAQVPIDAVLRIFATGGLPLSVRAGLHAEYRLVGPDGPVKMAPPTLVRTRIDLRPAAPLAPNTEYRVDQLFAYGTDGARVDDEARLRLAMSDGWVATRRWYPVSRFRTGIQQAAAVPVPAVAKADVHFAMGGGDCGPGTALWVEYTPVADPLAVVELMIEGHGVVSTDLMPAVGAERSLIRVSDMLCTPDKLSLGAKGPFKATVAFVNAAGKRAVGSPQTLRGGGLLRRPRPGRVAPDNVKWAELWFKGAIKESPAPVALGPASCPAGVELSASAVAAATGGRTAYDDRNAILWARGKAEALATNEADLGRVAPGRPFASVHTPASTVRSAPNGDGTVAIAGHHTDSAATLTALGFDATGQVSWRTPLATEQLNWKPRVARCGEIIAASWERIVDKQYGAARVHWALLDAQTGKITTRIAADAGLAIEGEGAALGCAGDGRIWLVGRDKSTRELRAIRLGADPLDVPLKGLRSTTSAVAPHATGLVVLTDRDGIQASILNANGEVKGAPILLSPSGRKPEVVPFNGAYLAAWERYPGAQVEATAFDLKGRVAEARQLGDGWSTVALRVAGERVALAATQGGAIRLAELRCAEAPGEGAPAQLPPQ